MSAQPRDAQGPEPADTGESLEVRSPARRRFIGQAGLAAGAALAASMLPPMAHAATVAPADGAPIGSKAHEDSASSEAADASWHIDDMWGHWPRYAHPIPHAGAAASPVDWEHVDPIDRMLVI